MANHVDIGFFVAGAVMGVAEGVATSRDVIYVDSTDNIYVSNHNARLRALLAAGHTGASLVLDGLAGRGLSEPYFTEGFVGGFIVGSVAHELSVRLKAHRLNENRREMALVQSLTQRNEPLVQTSMASIPSIDVQEVISSDVAGDDTPPGTVRFAGGLVDISKAVE